MHRIVIAFLIVLASPAGAAIARSTAGQRGIQILDYHLSLDLTRDPVFSGRVVITLKLTRNVGRLVLDANGLSISRASSTRGAVQFTHKKGLLVLRIDNRFPTGRRLQITLDYTGKAGRGLIWNKQQIVALFHTRRWLPCIDQPAARATLTLDFRVPPGMDLVAVGRRRSSSYQGKRQRWRLSQPHSPYLYGFVVSRLTTLRLHSAGRTYLLASVRHTTTQLRRIGRMLPAMVRFFERISGVPLPGRRFAVVFVQGKAAQELAGMAVIGARYADSLLKNPREDWLLAHELAHQWWGNRITNRDWGHFWLHEGLVTFLVAAFKEKRWGRTAYLREIALFRKRYRRILKQKQDRPLVHDRWRRSSEMGGPLPYSKGALVLHLLRKKLGERRFWRGLKRFSRRYFGRLVTTAQLRRELERSSGQSLKGFFKKWLFER